MFRPTPRLLVALLTTAFALAALAGCGGSKPTPVAEAPAPPPPPPAPRPAEPPKKKEEPKKEEPKKPDPPKPAPAPKKPEKPKRPDKFEEWSLDDYRTEHAERGNRLEQALKYLIDARPGDAEVSTLLIELLTYKDPPKPEVAADADEKDVKKAEQDYERSVQLMHTQQGRIFKTLLEGLAASGREESFAALKQVVEGALDTGADSDTAAKAALDAVGKMTLPAADDLVFRAATEADTIRPGESKWTPAQIQTHAMRLLGQRFSPELRVRMANHAVKDTTSADVRKALETILMQEDPANLQAQVVLYLDKDLEANTRNQLMLRFTKASAMACDELLGLPPEARGNPAKVAAGIATPYAPPTGVATPVVGVPAAGRSKLDPVYETVRGLWTLEFLLAIQGDVDKVDELDEGVGLISLAGSLPIELVRKTIHKQLQKNWDQQGDVKQLGPMMATIIRDPGLLVVLKTAPRKEDPAVRDRRQGKEKPPTGGVRPPAANDKADPEDKAKFRWMEASELLAQSFNARFHLAAKAQPASGGSESAGSETAGSETASGEGEDAESDTEEAGATEENASDEPASDEEAAADDAAEEGPDKRSDDVFGSDAAAEDRKNALPVKLHPDAQVVAEHHVVWPDSVAARLKGVEVTPLVVHYVRIEEEGVAAKIAQYYQKEIGKSLRRTLEDNGIWLDSLQQGPRTGWKQSIDVMITRPDAKENDADEKRKASDPENLVIEILTIAIPDPA